MKNWTRTALTFGIISAVVTLLLNWIGNATATGDQCHRGSPLGLLAFGVFLGLMGTAGFMTTRAGDTVGMATIAGLVAALVSAVGTVIAFVIIISSINVSQCVQAQNTTGISTQTLVTTGGIIAAHILSLLGLGIGAGAGAIGGLIGRRPAATA